MVAPVDGGDLPPLGREALGDPARHGVRRAAVVDHDHGQRVEAECGGELQCLVVRALVELGVTDEHHHAGADPLRPQTERRADAERQPVPERPAGDLDARHQVAVGVVAKG